MRTIDFKSSLKVALRVGSIVLSGAVMALGQQQINLSAGPAGVTMSDSSGVPMWGYTCGAPVVGSTANCAALNNAPSGRLGAIAVVTGGSAFAAATPPTVTIGAPNVTGGTQATATATVSATGVVTSITLTNAGSGYTSAPTVTIAGTPGSGATATALLAWSPVVITVPSGQTLQINLTNNLSFSAGATPNTIPTSLMIVGQLGGGLGNSATSIASPSHANAQPLTWPVAGSPPGAPLVGVGTPPAQGNRVQSFATEVAAGATTSLTWTTPQPGTYLLESGTHPSIQVPMGLYGMLVVTCPPGALATTCTTPGTAYPAAGSRPAVTYSPEVPLLFSEIDPVQKQCGQPGGQHGGFQRGHGVVRSAGRLRQPQFGHL